MDLINYRGYFIHFRGESSSWRFMAAPALRDLPIFSRMVSRKFPSRETALIDAKKQIDLLLAD